MNNLLEVRNLTKRYHGTTVVDNISFDLPAATTLGIVGESGSGKTTLVRMILRAIDPDEGTVRFRTGDEWHELHSLSHKSLIPLRQQMQMIFQDPFASLNPRMTVGEILEEPLIVHKLGKSAERREKVLNFLDRVGLPRDSVNRYPHAFSGGQRQRVGIARALILNPSLVVCDESVSALDVSVQAQIINLLNELQKDLGLTYLFVAHDLAVVRHICDDVLVLYQGKTVEQGKVAEVFDNPKHDYTKLLLSAIPSADPDIPLQPLARESLSLETAS